MTNFTYTLSTQNLFRGDIENCNDREAFLNMCFAQFTYAPKCETMGACFNFQEVPEQCMLTNRVFTIFEKIYPAFRRGEGEEPIQARAKDTFLLQGKPMKRATTFANYFEVTHEFDAFFSKECPTSQLPTVFGKMLVGVTEKMQDTVRSIDSSFEMLMWATLFSATERDTMGDAIWGDHPNFPVLGNKGYKNLYSGADYNLIDPAKPNDLSHNTRRAHKILSDVRKVFEQLRNPVTGEYMYCRENCIDVYVSRCLMEKLTSVLQFSVYAKTDSCCSNFEMCNTGFNLPQFIKDEEGNTISSPFTLLNGQFRFIECPALDQTKFEIMKQTDAMLPAEHRILNDILDINFDNAWLMVFPERIKENKILQKHFEEVPGNFRTEEKTLARVRKIGTEGRGWFDVVEGTGMVLYTGK